MGLMLKQIIFILIGTVMDISRKNGIRDNFTVIVITNLYPRNILSNKF